MKTTSPTAPVHQGNTNLVQVAPPAGSPAHVEFDVPDELVREVSEVTSSASPSNADGRRPRVSSYSWLRGAPLSASRSHANGAPRSSLRRKITIGALTLLILVVLAGLVAYVSGAWVPGSAAAMIPVGNDKANAWKEKPNVEKNNVPQPVKGVSLVEGKPHTIQVPEGVRITLGMLKGSQEVVTVAQAPSERDAAVSVSRFYCPGSNPLSPHPRALCPGSSRANRPGQQLFWSRAI